MSERRMDAYYYGFAPTGVDAIDRILSAVACAGKHSHHTESWNEEASYTPEGHEGATPVAWIQSAAEAAAFDAAHAAQRAALALDLAEAAVAAKVAADAFDEGWKYRQSLAFNEADAAFERALSAYRATRAASVPVPLSVEDLLREATGVGGLDMFVTISFDGEAGWCATARKPMSNDERDYTAPTLEAALAALLVAERKPPGTR